MSKKVIASSPAKSPAKNECMITGCDRKVETRGVCGTCYNAARKLVQDGQACWQDLETMGLVKPTHGPSKNAFRIAFLSATSAKAGASASAKKPTTAKPRTR